MSHSVQSAEAGTRPLEPRILTVCPALRAVVTPPSRSLFVPAMRGLLGEAGKLALKAGIEPAPRSGELPNTPRYLTTIRPENICQGKLPRLGSLNQPDQVPPIRFCWLVWPALIMLACRAVLNQERLVSLLFLVAHQPAHSHRTRHSPAHGS